MNNSTIFKSLFAFITISLLFSFCTDNLLAAVYYVSPDGSDFNSGSSSEPFKTIQMAANIVAAGDTVIVKDGTYNESISISRSGTESAWITFRSENKWGAKIDALYLYDHVLRSSGSPHHIIIDGFEITGSRDSGISFNGSDSYIKIYRNHIHHTGSICTGAADGLNGIKIGTYAREIYIDSNVIHDVGRKDIGEDGCGSSAYGYDHGIYTAANYIYITNNIFYNHKHGWAIQFSGGGGPKHVINNVFANPNPNKNGQIVIWNSHGPNTDVLIQNNIFYNPKSVAIYCYKAPGSTLALKNNLIFPESTVSFSSGCPSEFTEIGTIRDNPAFTDASSNDYHLQASSPAINAGIPTDAPGFDNEQKARDNHPDIGAFEYTAVLGDKLSPSPPYALSVQK